MIHRQKLIYLLADGAHARFLARRAETGAFDTLKQLDGRGRLAQVRAEQRDEPSGGRSFESASVGSHGVGREDAYRRAKEAFAVHVGETLGEVLAEHPADGVVLAAPARLLKPLRAALPPHAHVVAEIGKDLVKTPEHELERWLGPMALAALG